MATNYQRGRAFEYRVRDKLLKDGAVYVMRAASSKGAADLLALWAHPECPVPWLVQAKRGTGRLSHDEREELVSVADEAGAIPVLARPGKNGRGVVFTDLRNNEELS